VSPFGVFDMAGNAAEWVDATFCPYDKPTCAATTKVVRGGSWTDDRANGLTTSARGRASPETRMPDIGFRCAKD
jgi:iron(II)-dependent oxidoreductase